MSAQAVRELAEAIRSALDVPPPAAVEDWETKHSRAMLLRVAELRGALAWLAEDSQLREQDVRQVTRQARALAARPLPYEVRGDGAPERSAPEPARGCGLDGCPRDCPGAQHGCDYHHEGEEGQ